MTILVAGASGATGRLLVEQLLDRGCYVKAAVRSPDKLPEHIKQHERVSVIEASLLELGNSEMEAHVGDCVAVASCLGHNLTFRGVFGRPRRLVADATRRVCDAIKISRCENPVKYVLMNTAGNRNHDVLEPISMGQKLVIGIIRLLVPPHADNEKAANYLRTHIGQEDRQIQWAAVRPDTLINEGQVTEYVVHASPTRSAIFNPGKTSRINVAHFMAELITNEQTWDQWKGQMPVIYNKASS